MIPVGDVYRHALDDAVQRPAEPGRYRDGWTTWLPFTLMECHRCSALVMNNDVALDNHEAWHTLGTTDG